MVSCGKIPWSNPLFRSGDNVNENYKLKRDLLYYSKNAFRTLWLIERSQQFRYIIKQTGLSLQPVCFINFILLRENVFGGVNFLLFTIIFQWAFLLGTYKFKELCAISIDNLFFFPIFLVLMYMYKKYVWFLLILQEC